MAITTATPIDARLASRLGQHPARVLIYVVMALVAVVSLLPFVWAFLTSFKIERQVYAFPPQIFPNPITGYNYSQAITHGLLLALFNSLVISLAAVVLVLVAGSLAAYPLARINFRGSQVVMFLILVPLMIPGLVNLVPTYIIMAKLNLLDSYQGLILIYWVHSLPVAIWVLRGFFNELPRELEDAAAVDGASRVRILWSIIIPLSQPCAGGSRLAGVPELLERVRDRFDHDVVGADADGPGVPVHHDDRRGRKLGRDDGIGPRHEPAGADAVPLVAAALHLRPHGRRPQDVTPQPYVIPSTGAHSASLRAGSATESRDL